MAFCIETKFSCFFILSFDFFLAFLGANSRFYEIQRLVACWKESLLHRVLCFIYSVLHWEAPLWCPECNPWMSDSTLRVTWEFTASLVLGIMYIHTDSSHRCSVCTRGMIFFTVYKKYYVAAHEALRDKRTVDQCWADADWCCWFCWPPL